MPSGLVEQLLDCYPVKGVETPLTTLLLADQPGLLELADMIGDLGLTHPEVVLKLADADANVPLPRLHRGPEVRQTAAAPTLSRGGGHQPEHPHPDGVGEGLTQGDERLDPLLR